MPSVGHCLQNLLQACKQFYGELYFRSIQLLSIVLFRNNFIIIFQDYHFEIMLIGSNWINLKCSSKRVFTSVQLQQHQKTIPNNRLGTEQGVREFKLPGQTDIRITVSEYFWELQFTMALWEVGSSIIMFSILRKTISPHGDLKEKYGIAQEM